jgi:hypothetical protein
MKKVLILLLCLIPLLLVAYFVIEALTETNVTKVKRNEANDIDADSERIRRETELRQAQIRQEQQGTITDTRQDQIRNYDNLTNANTYTGFGTPYSGLFF